MPQGIALIGSTGSIGTQTLQVVAEHPERFAVRALACRRDTDLLEAQARAFGVSRVAVAEPAAAARLPADLDVGVGEEAILDLVGRDEIEVVVLAIVGAAAIPIAIRALAAGKRLALANKECLVAAGQLLTRLAAPGQIVPIDSEHSALHQALRGEDKDRLARLLLTASGGPFRDASNEAMARATLADALNHPTWRMGGKITIDSATLMNKGLEVIEARWLFDVDFARIEVVIHPQSIVHSMVEMCDGSVLAQMGLPDMRLPIQYALGFPERLPLSGARLNLAEVGTLTFARPDLDRFPCLRLAYEAGEMGGSAPAVLNAANEEAVARFMAGEIGFMEIPRLVEAALAAHDPILEPDLEAVLAADAWARSYAAARAARV